MQKALAISAFLMVYGAVLLAVGFWKRTAFIRWQALMLIVFTIAKTFLYDMRNLSQGYRVVSFLGLGSAADGRQLCVSEGLAGLRVTPEPDDMPARQRSRAMKSALLHAAPPLAGSAPALQTS